MGKAAGKLAEKAGQSKPEAPKPEDHCQVCNWHFETDNKRQRFFSRTRPTARRTEPRAAVVIRSHGALYTRCEVCWLKEQWHAGKHPHQGTALEATAREAIFSEFRDWPDEKRRAAVYNHTVGKYEL